MVDIQTNPLYYASIGGLLLGISTSLHYVLKGNVTGMSGIISDLAFFNLKQFPNKLIIVAGMLFAAGIFFDIFGYGTSNRFTPFGPKEQISSNTSYIGFALAGLLVGFGTKLGNGCTSGHGLCGLPRLSIRSFVAVMIFLSTAMGIATLKYYVTLGPFSENLSPKIEYVHEISANFCIFLGLALIPVGVVIEKLYNQPQEDLKLIIRDCMISWVVGLIFASGLIVAGMVRRINILQFLWLGKNWNPSLLFVLGCGVILNLIVFNYMIHVRKVPIFGGQLFNPDNRVIDWKLVGGSFCFGLGWGIGGLCPGPALALLPVFQVQIHVIWLGCLLIGMFCANKLVDCTTPKPQNVIDKSPEEDSRRVANIVAENSEIVEGQIVLDKSENLKNKSLTGNDNLNSLENQSQSQENVLKKLNKKVEDNVVEETENKVGNWQKQKIGNVNVMEVDENFNIDQTADLNKDKNSPSK